MDLDCQVTQCIHNDGSGGCNTHGTVVLHGDDGYHWLFSCSELEVKDDDS